MGIRACRGCDEECSRTTRADAHGTDAWPVSVQFSVYWVILEEAPGCSAIATESRFFSLRPSLVAAQTARLPLRPSRTLGPLSSSKTSSFHAFRRRTTTLRTTRQGA